MNGAHVDDPAVLHLEVVCADHLPIGVVRIGDGNAVGVLTFEAPDDHGGIAVDDDALGMHLKHPIAGGDSTDGVTQYTDAGEQ